jgi:hypothetical protein
MPGVVPALFGEDSSKPGRKKFQEPPKKPNKSASKADGEGDK